MISTLNKQKLLQKPHIEKINTTTISNSFNSLFKVLFIFPSRYLFAIGLSPVFSFRWHLPPDWCCNTKQHDSKSVRRTGSKTLQQKRDYHPRWLEIPKQLAVVGTMTIRQTPQFRDNTRWLADYQDELFPLHSPLLRES